MSRYLRRLVILFAIGLVHAYGFWWGDILRLYALLGLLQLPLGRLQPRALALLGVVVAIFLTPFLRRRWPHGFRASSPLIPQTRRR